MKRYKISGKKNEKYIVQQLENLDVFDPGRYNKM